MCTFMWRGCDERAGSRAFGSSTGADGAVTNTDPTCSGACMGCWHWILWDLVGLVQTSSQIQRRSVLNQFQAGYELLWTELRTELWNELQSGWRDELWTGRTQSSELSVNWLWSKLWTGEELTVKWTKLNGELNCELTTNRLVTSYLSRNPGTTWSWNLDPLTAHTIVEKNCKKVSTLNIKQTIILQYQM